MGVETCPKCDHAAINSASIKQSLNGTLEVDIAHNGETWERAKEKLDRAIDDALYYRYSGLKVIHGWGSQSGGQAVIGPRAKSYLRHIAEQNGGRFAVDRNTQGVSLVWFNK